MADPNVVSMIQTTSHLSPDAVEDIQMASLEPGLESSSIFIPDQLNTEAEVVQIILTWIDNDIYSTVDACPNAFLTSTTTKMEKHEFDEIIAKRQERTANPLALVAQQQPAYHPQNHPTHYTKKSSTRSQQAATRTNHDREQDDQDDNDLAKERDLLAL
ncbi:hypothetical protein Tco_0961624 [Tanacetum coccineum]